MTGDVGVQADAAVQRRVVALQVLVPGGTEFRKWIKKIIVGFLIA